MPEEIKEDTFCQECCRCEGEHRIQILTTKRIVRVCKKCLRKIQAAYKLIS